MGAETWTVDLERRLAAKEIENKALRRENEALQFRLAGERETVEELEQLCIEFGYDPELYNGGWMLEWLSHRLFDADWAEKDLEEIGKLVHLGEDETTLQAVARAVRK